MYIRYVQKSASGKVFGLFMGGFDLSGFTEAEVEEFNSHPAQLPSPDLGRRDCFFAFTGLEAELRWSGMVKLRSRAALGTIERLELNPENFEVIWSDDDQVALIPKTVSAVKPT